MKIIWLGHSGFRIEIEQAVLLVDPWLTGNPMFPEDQRDAALNGATHVLLTHGHGDHAGDALAISKQLDIPLVGSFDMISFWEADQEIKGIGFNKGGTVLLDGAKVTMVNATHSSSIQGQQGPIYAGGEAGFMISGEGQTIYLSGDTDVMADMGWMAEYHQPNIGIMSAGGHFTMDMARAAFAARKYFNFSTVIPCHYRTFPILEQDASALKAGLPPNVQVIEPQVMEAIIL